MNPGLRKLIFGLSLALLSVSIGIIGFMIIENYSFTQAVYMTGVSVVAYQTTGGSFQINPPAQTVLDPGGNFIVLGRRDELDHFQDVFLHKSKMSLVKH